MKTKSVEKKHESPKDLHENVCAIVFCDNAFFSEIDLFGLCIYIYTFRALPQSTREQEQIRELGSGTVGSKSTAMTLAERLATLRPQCESVDPEKGAGIELNRFAVTLVGPGPRGGSVNGSVLVSNARRRYDAQTPNERLHAWPHVYKARVVGSRDPCSLFEPKALVDTIRCILLPPRVVELFQNADDVEALRELLRRHAGDVALQESLDKLDAAVLLVAQDIQAVSALTGSSSQNIRWTRCPDVSQKILVSSDDIFRALGVEHPRQDWHDWLKREYEEAVQNWGYHRRPNLDGTDDPNETPIFMEKVLPGHPEPVRIIDRAAYRIMIGCYIHRGRLPPARIQAAWDLFERVNVGDRRVVQQIVANAEAAPRAAREFVLGAAEAQQQDQQQALAVASGEQIVPVRLLRRALRLFLGRQKREARRTHQALVTIQKVQTDMKALTETIRRNARPRPQPRRRTVNPRRLPPEQRATDLEAGPLALGLATVVLKADPTVPFLPYKRVRGWFGQLAIKERLRRHALGPEDPLYVEKPLKWAFTGPTVEGGGARYLYVQAEEELLQNVLLTMRRTSAAQRRLGAPVSESVLQHIQRLAAGLTDAERAVGWPVHASELEPAWTEA
jgi:hypothetical protein